MQLRIDEALSDLDAAIEGGVEDARAHWGRARALSVLGLPDVTILRDDDDKAPPVEFRKRSPEEARKEALADMARAVELQPLEARYRHELSLLMVGRAPFINYGEVKQKFDNPEAEAQAGLATELDPENEEYRQWLTAFQ
jgi:hypothetical protein